jgi:hypothetical protein
MPTSFDQFVAQDSAQDLITWRIQNLPYPGFSRYEFHVRCLYIRLDSQSVVCFHSVDFGSSCRVLMIFINISCGRHMMSGHVWSLSSFVFILVLEWHLLPSPGFLLFYSATNKLDFVRMSISCITECLSHINPRIVYHLIINNNRRDCPEYRRHTYRFSFESTYSPMTLANLSSINLVSIFRSSSPPHNPVYASRVDPSVLGFSLSSHVCAAYVIAPWDYGVIGKTLIPVVGP